MIGQKAGQPRARRFLFPCPFVFKAGEMKKIVRVLLALCVAFSVLQVFAVDVFALDTLYENFTGNNTSGNGDDNHWQTFIPETTHLLTQVNLMGGYVSGGSGQKDWQVDLKATSGGAPTGNSLAVAYVTMTQVTNASPYRDWGTVGNFNTSVQLNAGTMYAFALTRRSGNGYTVHLAQCTNNYARGTADVGNDWSFREYGVPATSNPGILTGSATNVQSESAMLNGIVVSMGTYSTGEFSFEYGETTGYGSETSSTTMTDTGIVSTSASGLNSNTTYHYRSKFTGSFTTQYGADEEFTTRGTSPTVLTENTTSITFSSATLNGNLTSLGDYDEVTVGMRIRENGTTIYSNYYPSNPFMNETGTYNVTVSSLAANTTYDVGAFAYYNNATQVAYGDVDQFDTLPYNATPTPPVTPPTVSTDSFIQIDPNTVKIFGTLSSMGSATSVDVGFLFGTGSPPEYFFDAYVTPLNETSVFYVTLTGLAPGTLYYYQARAEGDSTAFGEVKTLGTVDPAANDPIVITLPASSVTNTTALLNGELIQVGNHTPVTLWFNIRKAGETTWHTVTPNVQLSETGVYNMTANSTTVGFGIIPNTWYEYQAVVVNGYWRSDGQLAGYGDIETFLTNDQVTPPSFSFTLNPAGSITKYTAVLSGYLSNVNSNANATVYMDYGIGDYTVHSGIIKRTGPGDVSYTASSLIPNTLYWYQARVYVDDGYLVTTRRWFTTLTESGATPGVSPTPVVTPTPTPTGRIGPIPVPSDPGDRWLLVLAGLVLIPLVFMFMFMKIPMVGGGLSVAGDVVWFGYAIFKGWVDLWIILLLAMGVGALAIVIVWRVLHGRTA